MKNVNAESYIPIIAKRIIDSYNPEKIILFDSYSTGTARPESALFIFTQI